jgi:hypothetical protein
MSREYFEQLRVHVDEGNPVSHQNVLDLLNEVERLYKRVDQLGQEKHYFETLAKAWEDARETLARRVASQTRS